MYEAVLLKKKDHHDLEDIHQLALDFENIKQSVREMKSKIKEKEIIKEPENKNTKSNSTSREKKGENTRSIKKDFNKECLFCGEIHDFRDCKNGKFKYYTIDEAKALRKAKLELRPRSNFPKQRYSEETPFIKKAIENLANEDKPKKV